MSTITMYHKPSVKKIIMELDIVRGHDFNTSKNRYSLSNLHVNGSECVLSHQYIHTYKFFVFFKIDND